MHENWLLITRENKSQHYNCVKMPKYQIQTKGEKRNKNFIEKIMIYPFLNNKQANKLISQWVEVKVKPEAYSSS